MKPHFALFFLLTALSCARVAPAPAGAGVEYAQWFSLTDSSAVVHSPFGGPDDTLSTARPFTRFVCMSSSTVACLAAVGTDSLVRGVSGLAFVSDPLVRARASEVGYDAQPDYETILRLQPDLLLTYTVSSAEPPAMEKLRSLGICVVSLYDHLETHPLARAEYVRLVGALTGRRALADSVFAAVRDDRLRHVREEAGVRRRERDLHGLVVRRLEGRDLVVALDLGVNRFLDGEKHVRHLHRLPVMEFDAVAERERVDGRVIRHRVFLREAGLERALRRDLHQAVVDVEADRTGVRRRGLERVEVVDLGRDAEDELAAFRRRRLSCRRRRDFRGLRRVRGAGAGLCRLAAAVRARRQ